MQTASFTFAGHSGTALRDIRGTFVLWGGMSFQLEAAKPQLRAAIEKALADDAATQQQINQRARMGSLPRNARKAEPRGL